MENMNPPDFIVAILSTWYISYILTAQTGPFLILEKVRDRAGGVFDCIYCIAPYVAGIVWLVMQYIEQGNDIAQVFAIAGGALMLRSYTGVGLHDV
jgi:hypothetical protein